MCLTKKEQRIYEGIKAGKSYKELAKELNLALSSVRTYWYKIKVKLNQKDDSKIVYIQKKSGTKNIKRKIQENVALAIAGIKGKMEPSLKRCSSFTEFTDMMQKISVKGITLEDRVKEFKDVYCKVCIYPNMCKECPTKVLMDKYLTV